MSGDSYVCLILRFKPGIPILPFLNLFQLPSYINSTYLELIC